MLPSRQRRVPLDQQLAAASRLRGLHPAPPDIGGWLPPPEPGGSAPVRAAVERAPAREVPAADVEPYDERPTAAAAGSAQVPQGGTAAEPGRHRAAAAVQPGPPPGRPDHLTSWQVHAQHQVPAGPEPLPPTQVDHDVPVQVPAGPGLPPPTQADRDVAPAVAQPQPPPQPPPQPAAGRRAELRDRLEDRMPLWTRTAVVAPSWRAVLALALVGVVAVVLTAGMLWRSRPHESGIGTLPAVPARGGATGTAAGLSASPTASVAPTTARPALVVAVAGKVRHPGVVRLPAGARVQDALRAAGGLRPGASLGLLNLARPVVDGEQILVGVTGGSAAGPPPAPGPGSGSGSGGTGGAAGPVAGAPVDLNAATESDLEQLPGVGPVLAQRILDWRTAHGSFSSVDQLRQVSGIGDKKFADLKDQVRV